MKAPNVTGGDWIATDNSVIAHAPEVQTTQGVAVSHIATAGKVLMSGSKAANLRLLAQSKRLAALAEQALNLTLPEDCPASAAFQREAREVLLAAGYAEDAT